MRSFLAKKFDTTEKGLELVARIVIVCICLLQMSTLETLLRRHWGSLLSYQRMQVIALLVLYPIPFLHLFRRFQNPLPNWVLVFLTYSLLSSATSLIFR